MAYVFPIPHRNTHAIYNRNTLQLIDQWYVAMVTDNHFEYANQVVKFSEILLKNVFLRSTEIQEYNIISIHKKILKIHHRWFEEAFNRYMYTNE